MDNVIRITFPSFSRLSNHTEYLAKAIQKTIFITTLCIFPVLVGLSLLAPSLIELIPRYQKWEPALLSLSLFAFNAAVSSISTPLTNALNAIGKVKTTLYLMIFWFIATWVFTPLSIYLYGFEGVAIASAIISISVVGVVVVVKRYIPFSVMEAISIPAVASIIMGAIVSLLNMFLPVSFLTVGIVIAVGVLSYVSVVLLFARHQLRADFRELRSSLKK